MGYNLALLVTWSAVLLKYFTDGTNLVHEIDQKFPSIFLIENQAVVHFHNYSKNMTYELSPEQQKVLRLSCVSNVPNIWAWEQEDISQKPKMITKQRSFINDSLSIFVSNLTVNLGNDIMPVDTNFSCTFYDDTFDTAKKQTFYVSCVEISYVDIGLASLLVYDGILYKDCHKRTILYSIRSGRNCSTKFETVDAVDEAECERSENSNWNQCDDLDSCNILLETNVRDTTCQLFPESFASNMTGAIFPGTNSETLFPQVFGCSHSRDYLDGWKSYLPVYPSFGENISANLLHYVHPGEAYRNSVHIYEIFFGTEVHRRRDLKNLSSRTQFAINETVTFACIAVGYLYMNGFQWKFGNLTLNGHCKDDKRTDDGLIVSLLNIKFNTYESRSVSCLAPIWNTYEFKTVTTQVFIYESTLPHARITCEKADYFFRCLCTYTGWPKPELVWHSSSVYELSNEKHDTQDETHKYTNSIHPHKLVWQKYIAISLHSKNESFISCKVQNARGKYEDKFKFHPERKSSLLLLILVPILVLVIMVAVTATYFVKRYRTKYTLSRQELNEFFQGNAKLPSTINEGSEENTAMVLPYDLDRYEISNGNFQIDSLNCLGSGASGFVCKGSITRDGIELDVAVKRIRNSDITGTKALKGLLSEIKILSYVGNHNHIVALVGAYTAELETGKLIAFIELCEMGSLEAFLQNIARSKQHPSIDVPQIDDDLKQDFSRWSKEIATGMEYLSFKKVIHADLATRNILLTSDKCAKISDFGLSRRLYEYKDYVKKQQEPLPWRWMAPESLRRLEFNEKTDVWAFGITLWEIYTLGDKPYPGLSFDSSFCALLQQGYRCGMPLYADSEMFEIMKSCWENCPNLRPTFSILKTKLTGATYVNVD